jgi:hypothetical protein
LTVTPAGDVAGSTTTGNLTFLTLLGGQQLSFNLTLDEAVPLSSVAVFYGPDADPMRFRCSAPQFVAVTSETSTVSCTTNAAFGIVGLSVLVNTTSPRLLRAPALTWRYPAPAIVAGTLRAPGQPHPTDGPLVGSSALGSLVVFDVLNMFPTDMALLQRPGNLSADAVLRAISVRVAKAAAQWGALTP